MEWLVVVAALACPIGMLAMGAIAWAVGKRAGRDPDATEVAQPRSDRAADSSAIGPA